ncbi:hypothetical protein TruAng_001140 [Truncatella angustata]|nr:hypothetical protein TruAng_001140 [Truncatella angustata]
MDGVIPARNGKSAFRYTWDEDGAVKNIEPLEKVRARTEGLSSHSRHTPKDSSSRVNWPFHYRATSEVPSTAATSHFSHFRRATAQSKSWFKEAGDSASILSRSLVPDYVVHYLRGETPESLARKKEEAQWGERNVVLTPQRERLMSQQAFFEDPFGSRAYLALGESENETPQRGARRLLSGWRGGVAFNTLSAFLILLVAVVCLVVIITESQTSNGASTLYSGSCTTAYNLNIGLHVLINALSIVLLVGGNYVFQVLSSPTRDELTAAHDKKQWLDIGIPSLRNLRHISTTRTALATVVLLATVAIQVIYNAVVFTSQASSSPTCSVIISSPLLGVVAFLNLAAFGSIAILLSRSNFEPLATLGDAIRTFLSRPDPTTTGTSLLSKQDVRDGRWGYGEAKYFAPGVHLWLFSPSLARWSLMIFSWVALAVPTALALGLAIYADPASMSTQFGTATPDTSYLFPSPISRLQMALLTSLPQFLLAILYLVTNSHLSTYYLSHELTLFALGPRGLRVSSDPAGAQTTSLYLTLPRPISWVLLVLFIGMGFVLSQAVFPATATLSASISTSTYDMNQAISVGLSTQALLILLALLFALMLMVVGLGLRQSPAAALVNGQEKGNPLALKGGSCSAALSAKCHTAAGEVEPWRQELTWGVVADGIGMQQGRCGFSALSVGAVDVGRAYA